MIHLDTCFLVDLLREARREESGPATTFIRTVENETVGISVFAVCELYAGARLSRTPASELENVERLCRFLHVDYPDERFAPVYGSLLADLERARQQISAMDLLIATSATVAEVPLVTRNRKDFARVPGLKIVEY
jgi:tRNA(fMet)-specific endonuclease VapC